MTGAVDHKRSRPETAGQATRAAGARIVGLAVRGSSGPTFSVSMRAPYRTTTTADDWRQGSRLRRTVRPVGPEAEGIARGDRRVRIGQGRSKCHSRIAGEKREADVR